MTKTKPNPAELRNALCAELSSLQAKFETEMRGRIVASPRAIRLRDAANAVQAEIDSIDREAAERLALEKAPIDEVLQIVAVPLLADVMNDIVAEINGMLLRRGCAQTVFSEYTAALQKAAMKMVDTLAMSEAGLPNLLDVDDTLVAAVKKKLMSFIKQRMNITD